MPLNSQAAPLLASLSFQAKATSASGAEATSLLLQVPVLGNLCGGVTGTGGITKLFEGFNPPTPINLAGSVLVVTPALAFEGFSYGTPTVSPLGGTAGTTWGSAAQVPDLFPASGKLVTQVAVYLDPNAAFANGQTFYYTVALNGNGAGAAKFRDFFFSFGWYNALNSGLGIKAFWVTYTATDESGIDATLSNPIGVGASSRVPITQAGWYILQHTFVADNCTGGYATGAKCVKAQMKVFKTFTGASCGSVLTSSTNVSASWEIKPRPQVTDPVSNLVTRSDAVDKVGSVRYGLFGVQSTPTVITADAFSYTLFTA
jgi:hypothetical protein